MALGLSGRQWFWLHESERWQALIPGVSVAHVGEPTQAQLLHAAVLHCGDGAALTGDHALVQYGFSFRELRSAVHVAVPEGRVVRRPVVTMGDAQLVVVPHQVRRLAGLVHPSREPSVVRAAPALLHAAAFAVSDRAAEWRLAAGVQQGVVGVKPLREALGSMPRLRRRALVRAVLDDVEFGAHARSELDFLGVLRRHSLPLPDRLQQPVRANGMKYLDAWWKSQRVAAEVDGAHHRDAGSWDADVLRTNEVHIAGRREGAVLVRFTTGNLRHDEVAVVRQLRALLL